MKWLRKIRNKNITEIMGYPDNLKLNSSMTLFDAIENHSIFEQVLERFYGGERDKKTLELLKKRNL